MLAFLIVVGFLASATAAYLVGISRADARRKEVKALRAHARLSSKAINEIDIEVDQYREIDSILAVKVRNIIRKLREERNEIEK